MAQDDPPPEVPRRQLFEDADRIANAPRVEQLAWLDDLRERLASHPKCDSIVRNMDQYLQTQRQSNEAKVRRAQIGEQMEAQFLSKLDELLGATKGRVERYVLSMTAPHCHGC